MLQNKKNVTYVNKNGNQIDLSKIAMSIDDLIRYREKVLRDCSDIQREIDQFREENDPIDY